MTKKDYVMIARIIAEATAAEGMPLPWASGCDSAREYIARHLADALQADNPQFDRARFLAACGVQYNE